MSIIQADFFSKVLMRRVPFMAILPTDRVVEGKYEEIPQNGYKTMYLIHGITDDDTDWLTGTRIKFWAIERNLAVIMPSGDNSFYVDTPLGRDYGEYIGRELVEQTRRMFPLSRKREDTFLAGQSMGGFGALRNGLKYNNTFGSIVALSSALHIFEPGYDHSSGDSLGALLPFGDMDKACVSDKNPRVLVQKLLQKKRQDPSTPIPKIYMDCGRQDTLYASNQTFLQYLRDNGIDVTYQDDDGVHGWEYWDKRMPYALDWLPLDEKADYIGKNN